VGVREQKEISKALVAAGKTVSLSLYYFRVVSGE